RRTRPRGPSSPPGERPSAGGGRERLAAPDRGAPGGGARGARPRGVHAARAQ
ncbi:unnamed protein product, partial [Heterosigma akashiwo]